MANLLCIQYFCCVSFTPASSSWSYGRVSVIQVRHNKEMGTTGLSFYHPNLLCCLDQMLTVTELSQHLVLSSKTVRPIISRGARCVRHVKIMWSAVCSWAANSVDFYIEFKIEFEFSLFYEFEFNIFIFAS